VLQRGNSITVVVNIDTRYKLVVPVGGVSLGALLHDRQSMGDLIIVPREKAGANV